MAQGTEDFAARLSAAVAARDSAAVDLSAAAFGAFQEVWTALDSLDAEVKLILPKASFVRFGGPQQTAKGIVEVRYIAKNEDGISRSFDFLTMDAKLITLAGMPRDIPAKGTVEDNPAFDAASASVLVGVVQRELIGWLAAPRPKRIVKLWD